MKPSCLPLALAVLAMFACARTDSGQAAETEGEVIAELVLLQGTVQVKVNEGQIYQLEHTNQVPHWPIKAGCTVGTGEGSRCNIILRDKSIVTLGPYSSVRFAKKDQRLLTRLMRGVLSFFHRDKPGELEIESAEVAAVIYGTEFVFAVAENGTTTLTLYDGRVEMTGGLRFSSGDVVVAESGKPPRKTATISRNNLEAIQWNLYYPAVVDLSELPLDPDAATALARSISAYRAGDLLGALAAYPKGRQPATPEERVLYAALPLSVGDVATAEQWLSQAQTGLPARFSNALRQLIAAVKLQPNSIPSPAASTNLLATEWMALSYAQQSRGDLEGALKSAQAATEQSPRFGFAWARVAELQFSFGRLAPAQAAQQRALLLAPRNAQAQALQGFIACGQYRFAAGHERFEQALALDGALGNAWLGRGLCRMHQGDVVGGRLDLEIAAAMEPQRALLRSYLGKAFFEEEQWDLAARELDLAKAKDPLDPTAWLYSALLSANRNRINEAIRDLEQSKSLNDNRYLYRSRLSLDQDRAVRGANLAALYRDAGMTEVALREASRAVDDDYANASAHAFLANAYDALRDPRLINLRYETPWFDELLMANLLAPPGVGTLSQNVSQQEYSRLFDRNRLGLLSSTEYYSRGDWRQSASQFGQYDSMSYAVDVDFRDENGQRINEDRQATAVYAKTKLQLTPQDSLLVMANTLDYHAGDLAQYYDPKTANPKLRMAEYEEPNLFLGYHREWQPGSHTLLLLGRLDDTLKYDDPLSSALVLSKNALGQVIPHVYPDRFFSDFFHVQYQRQLEAYSAELQQIWQPGSHTLVAGGRYQVGWPTARLTLETPSNPLFNEEPLQQSLQGRLARASIYLYDQWQVHPAFQIHLGLAYDHLEYPANLEWAPLQADQKSAQRLSPKLGFAWTLGTNTYLRGAWTRSLGGSYHDQSLRLEPTLISGFNQAYRSLIPESSPNAAAGLIPAARFETWGLGVDHRFPTRTYLGLEGEVLREEAERDLGVFESVFPQPAAPSFTRQTLDYTEKSLALTLNQLLGQDWSVGMRYRVSRADLELNYPWLSAAAQQKANVPLNTDGSGLLQEVRLCAAFNHPSGFFSRLDAHWHDQSNTGAYANLAGDSFWQLDAFVGYRFWQRRATAQLGLLNITDQDYRLNPLNLYQELPRRRTLAAQVRLAF